MAVIYARQLDLLMLQPNLCALCERGRMEEFGVNHGLQTYNNIVHVFAIESSIMQEQYSLGCWTLGMIVLSFC